MGSRSAGAHGSQIFGAVFICVALATSWVGGTAARANADVPSPVGMVAPRESRLADDLRRELGASSFVVVLAPRTAADWREDARRLPGPTVLHGVTVTADERVIVVFSRHADGRIEVRFEQPVIADDRLARRRACLSVVEYVRFLIASDDESPSLNQRPSQSPAAEVSSVARDRPSAAARSKADSVRSEDVARGPTAADAAPPAVSSMPLAPGPPSPTPAAPSPTSNAPGTPSAVAQPSALLHRDVPPAALGPSAPSSSPADKVVPPPLSKPWKLGAATTFGLAAAPGGPTVHLQFSWYLPLEWRLAACVRALWPVLGGQFRTEGNDVRTWGFGAGVSLQYLFESTSPRLEPFVGAMVGPRAVLAETTAAGAAQSHESFTPSLSVGAEGGLRYQLGALVQVLVEVDLSRAWLIPGVQRLAYEEGAAKATAFHASFGVVFEI